MSKDKQQFEDDQEILKALEKGIGKSIPVVDEVDHLTVGAKMVDKRVVVLRLQDCELTELPEIVCNLTALEVLYLQENELMTLPEAFGKLKALKELWLYNNQLKELPESFGQLESLETLNLSGNQLGSLPDSFRGLESLRDLWLYNNQLKTLPESFGSLHSLQTLWLHHNQINTLPDSFGLLESLQELILESNDLTAIPPSFGALKSLTKLNLYDNKLTQLPGPLWRLPLQELILDRNPWHGKSKPLVEEGRDLHTILEYCREQDTLKVFISHDWDDQAKYRVQDIRKNLQAREEIYKVFICEESTGNIQKFMDDRIPQSQILLFIGTQESLNSKFCRQELGMAKAYGVHIIPVKGTDIQWTEMEHIELPGEDQDTLDLSLEKGIPFTPEAFGKFCDKLYEYIKHFKRDINLFDPDKARLDKQKLYTKTTIVNFVDSDDYLQILMQNIEKFEAIFQAVKKHKISPTKYIDRWAELVGSIL